MKLPYKKKDKQKKMEIKCAGHCGNFLTESEFFISGQNMCYSCQQKKIRFSLPVKK